LTLLAGFTAGVSGGATEEAPLGLVFERNGDLYAITLDGSGLHRLTSMSAIERDPAVSPDGRRIAYERGSEVWLMNADGSHQRRLLSAGGRFSDEYAETFDPSWSPDGRTIVVARSATTSDDICGSLYRIEASGAGLRRITTNASELHLQPAVSPDGSRIAFIAAECDPGLWSEPRVVGWTGRPARDLRKLPEWTDFRHPAWSPDGRRIALQNGVDLPPWVYVANRDGSGLRRITPRGLFAETPAWSPDGEWIAFSGSTQSSSYDLFVIRPDGTGLRRVTRTASDEQSPAWSRK
jgi:TolB protein